LVATYLAVPAALAGSDLVATVPRRVAELIAATARVAATPLQTGGGAITTPFVT
jgi:hypothetical protein